MGRGADVPQAVHGCAMPWRLREGAEEEVLVERARAAVDVAADQVDVQPGDVGRREDDALQCRALEVLDVAAEPGGDAISVGLAQLLRPGSVTDVELTAGIALDASGWKLLKLDPDDPRAVRGARRIDRQRLAAGDGRLRGKEPALGLVDGARDTVDRSRAVRRWNR